MTPRAKIIIQQIFVPSQLFCFNAVGGPLKLREYIFASSEIKRRLPHVHLLHVLELLLRIGLVCVRSGL